MDTLPNQRRDSAWYAQVVAQLEKEVTPRPGKILHAVLRPDAVRVGQDWGTIRDALKGWLQREGQIAKLAPRKNRRNTTVLLLENDDIALMNHVKFSEAVRAAYPDGRPPGVDQLWYVSTAIQPTLQVLDLSKMWEMKLGVPMMWPPES